MFSAPLSVIVLAIVFVLIAVRRVGTLRLQIWQVMLAGAIAVLLTGQISPLTAISYVDPTVIVFLLGIFVVGQALTESGYMQYLSYRLFRRAKSVDSLVLLILFAMGLASAFLMNDTLAIIGTPVMLFFAARERINPKLMLMALAFAVTIGSVASPIGNPQNLLIASSGLLGAEPFATFFARLAIPTVINLLIAFALLRLFYRDEFRGRRLAHESIKIKDVKLAGICKISLSLLVISIIAYITTLSLKIDMGFNLAYIAVISAAPILILSEKRARIVRDIDWGTIVFFIALFILVGSVWQSGFINTLMQGSGINFDSMPAIFGVSIIGSQFISNVPMVLLYLKLLSLTKLPVAAVMALAAGSTIAGNMFILGAASNVIIVQNAEKRSGQTLTSLDFAKIGIPLTILSALVYWAFLSL
jgi:Na+/H+ antiporter NhaD/arsenite permease-like protein